MTGKLTGGTRRDGFGYTGVVRRGSQVVWECGHLHRNRDNSSFTNGPSARDCMTQAAKAARLPDYRREVHTRLASPGRGPYDTPDLLRRLAAAGEVAAAAFEERVTTLAALVGDGPLHGYADHLILPAVSEARA